MATEIEEVNTASLTKWFAIGGGLYGVGMGLITGAFYLMLFLVTATAGLSGGTATGAIGGGLVGLVFVGALIVFYAITGLVAGAVLGAVLGFAYNGLSETVGPVVVELGDAR